jgi:signal transduction histidine kinase
LRDRAVASEDAAKRLWSILSGMIELAELETVGAIEPQPMDLNVLVEAIVTGRHGDAERREVALTEAMGAALMPVVADEKRLSRAIDAIVLNALQYTLAGGSVEVRTACRESMASVIVKDSGMGISADDLPHIFDRFFRADRARSTETGGAGLGLPLAKSIVESHGGRIDVESAAGAGSTFRITIPVDQPEHAAG